MNVDKAVLMASFARMDVIALAVAVGCVCAIVLLFGTISLLLKGAPVGEHMGPHLGMLSVYLPGYSVSWSGSVVGAFYAGLIGVVMGFVWGILWNLTHYLYIILVVARANWWRLMAD